MSYTKVTKQDITKRINDGQYDRATSAKRAVGKCSLSNKDKASCYQAVALYFKNKTKPTKGKLSSTRAVLSQAPKQRTVINRHISNGPKTVLVGFARVAQDPRLCAQLINLSGLMLDAGYTMVDFHESLKAVG